MGKLESAKAAVVGQLPGRACLKDGSEVEIRELGEQDLDRSLAFFSSLPEEDRKYLRCDVTRREIVKRRIHEVALGNVRRLVALVEDQIVADGALEMAGREWASHMGELRLVVARSFQRRGLGMLMARELYTLAAGQKVEILVVRMMRPQVAAHHIFTKLGFREQALLAGHVRDLSGKSQDLLIMRCDLAAMWEELEQFFAAADWQRAR